MILQVDAALDLSHTQNIGRMIKAHFPHSQVGRCYSLQGNMLHWKSSSTWIVQCVDVVWLKKHCSEIFLIVYWLLLGFGIYSRSLTAVFPLCWCGQFIVVSLKEGMFNNANVIFRTKFVDGVSTVTRTVPTGRQVATKASRPTLDETSQGKILQWGLQWHIWTRILLKCSTSL